MYVRTLHLCMFSIVRTSNNGTVTNETVRNLEPIIQVSTYTWQCLSSKHCLYMLFGDHYYTYRMFHPLLTTCSVSQIESHLKSQVM